MIRAIIILLCAVFLLPGCFDYKLKVGYLGFHRKIMLRDKPEELAKLEKGLLRAAPGPGAAVLQVLEPGTVLEPLRYAANFYQVKTPEGRQGWIYQSQVYRIPVYEAIYDLQYHSNDNQALTFTLPLLIILLCFLFLSEQPVHPDGAPAAPPAADPDKRRLLRGKGARKAAPALPRLQADIDLPGR